MELTIRHIGSYGGRQAKIIELTISDSGSTITTDVTGLNNKVDESLINSLREIADQLEEQNILVEKDTNSWNYK